MRIRSGSARISGSTTTPAWPRPSATRAGTSCRSMRASPRSSRGRTWRPRACAWRSTRSRISRPPSKAWLPSGAESRRCDRERRPRRPRGSGRRRVLERRIRAATHAAGRRRGLRPATSREHRPEAVGPHTPKGMRRGKHAWSKQLFEPPGPPYSRAAYAGGDRAPLPSDHRCSESGPLSREDGQGFHG